MDLFRDLKNQISPPQTTNLISSEKKKLVQLQVEQIGKLDQSVNAMLVELNNTKQQTAELYQQLQSFIHEESMTEYLHLQSCITQESKNTSSDITNHLSTVQSELLEQLEEQQSEMRKELSAFRKQQKRIQIILILAMLISILCASGIVALIALHF